MPDFDLDEGLLTKRISIYAQPTGANALNEHTTAGALVCKLWAELNPADSAYRVTRDELTRTMDNAEAVDVFRTRYDSRVSETHAIHWKSQVWRIVGIQIQGASQAMDIKAVRVGVDDTSNI